MRDHKELDEPMGTEEAKELELDEQPKPTRKVTSPSVPVSDEPTSRRRKVRENIKILSVDSPRSIIVPINPISVYCYQYIVCKFIR
jgi:hypothetical protein